MNESYDEAAEESIKFFDSGGYHIVGPLVVDRGTFCDLMTRMDGM